MNNKGKNKSNDEEKMETFEREILTLGKDDLIDAFGFIIGGVLALGFAEIVPALSYQDMIMSFVQIILPFMRSFIEDLPVRVVPSTHVVGYIIYSTMFFWLGISGARKIRRKDSIIQKK